MNFLILAAIRFKNQPDGTLDIIVISPPIDPYIWPVIPDGPFLLIPMNVKSDHSLKVSEVTIADIEVNE